MARTDWRKYYVLTFSDGTCSPYFYRNLGALRRIVSSFRRSSIRPHITGIVHVKGMTPKAQNAIYSRVIDKQE